MCFFYHVKPLKISASKVNYTWSGKFSPIGWNIGGKGIGSKDASVKLIYSNTLDYKVTWNTVLHALTGSELSYWIH